MKRFFGIGIALVLASSLIVGCAQGGPEEEFVESALEGGCHWDCPKCPPGQDVLCPARPCILVCPPEVEQCGHRMCPMGQVCCNESCGICTEPFGACTEQLCLSTTPKCNSDLDCRTYSNYCDGCACEALGVLEPDPICKGTIVQCFVDPCMNQTAVCDPQSRTCVLK